MADRAAKEGTLMYQIEMPAELKSAITQLRHFTIESWSRDFHEKAYSKLGKNS